MADCCWQAELWLSRSFYQFYPFIRSYIHGCKYLSLLKPRQSDAATEGETKAPALLLRLWEKRSAFLAEFSRVIDAVGVRHFHTISATSWGKQKRQRLRRRLLLRSFCLVFIDAFHSTFEQPKRPWWDKAITALIIIITERLQICISVQFIALGWGLQ